MPFLNLNGVLVSDEEPQISINNRAFRFGDGLFETIRVFDGKIPFLNDHWQRLAKGMDLLGYSMPDLLSEDYILKASEELRTKNDFSENMRLKVQLYREEGLRYQPTNDKAGFAITAEVLSNNQFEINESGVSIGVYADSKKSADNIANCKTSSALIYVLAAQYAARQGWDDALVINTSENVIEAVSSNIFVRKGTNLHTPSLKEGPVAGVVRKNLLGIAAMIGYQVSAGKVTKQMLLDADEILLTNSIQGVKWVSQFENKTYTSKAAKELTEHLNKLVSTKD